MRIPRTMAILVVGIAIALILASTTLAGTPEFRPLSVDDERVLFDAGRHDVNGIRNYTTSRK